MLCILGAGGCVRLPIQILWELVKNCWRASRLTDKFRRVKMANISPKFCFCFVTEFFWNLSMKRFGNVGIFTPLKYKKRRNSFKSNVYSFLTYTRGRKHLKVFEIYSYALNCFSWICCHHRVFVLRFFVTKAEFDDNVHWIHSHKNCTNVTTN